MNNRRKMRALFIGLLLALAAVVMTAAACHPGHHRGPQTQEEATAHMLQRLDESMDAIQATDPQRAALRPLVEQASTRLWALRGLREQGHQALLGQIKAGKYDAAALHKLLDEAAPQLQATAHALSGDVLKAHAVLTPAQREQLADHLDARREERHARFKRGHRGDHKGPGPGMDFMLERLGATPAQAELAAALRDDLHAEREAARKGHEARHDAVRAELLSDDPDAAVLARAIDDTAAELRAAGHRIIDRVGALADTLTPDQWARLQRFAERMGPR
jgi:Spy/CpxP family protein refolding chaperone